MLMVGIGDLHLDGKLSSDIPNFNDVIGNEIRSVLKKARRKGIKLVLLYGDLCERPRFSDDAVRVLLEVFTEFSDLKFIAWKGNHDTLGPGVDEATSLDILHHMIVTGLLKNVKVVRHVPTDFFTDTDHPLRILPWPYHDTKAEFLNGMHVEVAGSHWETGRPTESSVSSKHLCVVGHIHTAQKVRKTHFSGTLYQTTFGEAEDKFYHEIDWTGDVSSSTIELISHHPKYVLKNAIIRSEDDYTQVCKEIDRAPDTTLWKVFVNNKKILLPVNAFDKYPTIIKHSPYSTKAELQAALQEELVIDDRSSSISQDTNEAFGSWMEENRVPADLRKKAKDYVARLIKGPTRKEPHD